MENTQIVAIVTIVMAVCQAVKIAGLNSRWIPLLSLVLAITGSFLFAGVSFLSTSAGVLLGLSTSGLFDVVNKSVFNK